MMPMIRLCRDVICEHIEAEWRIYVSVNWVIIGLVDGLSPELRQAIIWANVWILLIGQTSVKY